MRTEMNSGCFRNALRCIALIGLMAALAGCGPGGGPGNDGGGGGSAPVTMTLSASVVSSTEIRLSWTDTHPTSYLIYVNGAYYDTIYAPGNAYTVSSLRPNTNNCFRVYASSFPFGVEGQSNEACMMTPPDVPPSTPGNLTSNAISPVRIDLSWDPATDDYGVTGYKVYRNGAYLSTATSTAFSDTGAAPGSTYCYAVSATDLPGNESSRSGQACATTPADTEPPTAPASLTATADSAGLTVLLSWNASTDNGAVAGYQVFRNGTFLNNNPTEQFTDATLSPFTQYCYTVAAYDEVGNLSAASNQACATTSWKMATLDGQGDTGLYASLALDAGGAAHISYYDGTYLASNLRVGDLRYATNAGGAWSFATIDSQGDVGSWSSIDLDASGKAHVSYMGSNFTLRHATEVTGGWAANTVDGSGVTGYDTSLAARPGSGVHISYRGVNALLHATNASGTWVTETVGSAGVVGEGPETSIKLDAAGKVHISYYDGMLSPATGFLKYATNASGAWSVAVVDGGTDDTGWFSSLALDTAGHAHISYYDRTLGYLRYATNSSGAWQTFTIDSAGDAGSYSAIAVDAANRVHISYVDAGSHALKYATNAGGSWKVYILDSTAWVEGNTSIAVDAAGNVHIAYRGNHALRYATTR